MTIRRGANGSYYCNGHDCGSTVRWMAGEEDDGADGIWVCPDCNASMYGSKPTAVTSKADGQSPQ